MEKRINKWYELRQKLQQEMNEFPIGFAFTDSQFEKEKQRLGVTSEKELIGIPAGGFIRATDKDKFLEMIDRHEKAEKEFWKSEELAYDMFIYELRNHEYGYTGEIDDTLDSLGITEKILQENEILLRALEKACRVVRAEGD